MYKTGNKIVAGLIVFIMLIANIMPIGAQIGTVIAEDGVAFQNSKTNHNNVEFDSYFLEGQNGTHDSTKKIGEDNKIVAWISVKDAGYLKDARIDFVDSNFKVSNENDSEKVAKIENNAVVLNQVDAGEDAIIALPFTFEHDGKINLDQFDKISTAKLTGTYVDEKGKAHSIIKDIKLALKWTADAEASVSAEVTKYLTFDVNNQKGLVMQMLVKESVLDNKLPVKESNIELTIPEVNGAKPNNVTVYSSENMEFTFDEYKVNITTKNDPNESNEVIWKNNAERVYQVTYIYPEKAITEEEVNVKCDIKSNLTTYAYGELKLDAKYDEVIALKDRIGEIVDAKVETTDMVSKGYMYANLNREDKLETEYTEKVTANISAIQLIDSIVFDLKQDSFTNGDSIYLGNSYYKDIKITKSEFNKFFGEEGKIEIYNGSTLIKTIDKEIEEDNIVIEANADSVTVITSKPIKNGNFTFAIDKAIKSEDIYSKEQIEQLENIGMQIEVKANNGDLAFVDKTIETKTALVEPILQAEFKMNNNNLSTVVTNNDVELRAVLKTSSVYNTLFENPVITIDVPEYIEKIDIKNIQVLFDDELTVKSYDLNGNQIVIELEGIQTNYNIDSVYGGTNIVITADITTNILTPNKTEKMTMHVVSNEEEITSEIDVNFIAPSGVVAVNKISNFADGQEIMALTNDKSAMLEVQTSAKNAKEEIQVINNYNNKIENIEILGRTLAKDTTNTANGQSLNNTLDVPMLGAINTNGVENAQVYYSANGSATKDLNDANNGWTQDVADFSKVKSYLIVLDQDTEMGVGETVKFDYDMQIPENLQYSEVASSQYSVYFDNVQEEQTLEDQVISRTVTLGTGTAPNMQVVLSSNVEENSVAYQGQYVRFIATIKNNSSVDAENVKLNVLAPSGSSAAGSFTTKHVEYVEEAFNDGYEVIDTLDRTIEVGTIKAGQEAKVSYDLLIDSVTDLTYVERIDANGNRYKEKVSNDSIILTTNARVIADKMQKEVASNEYSFKLEESDITIFLSRSASTDSILTKGNNIDYTATIHNKNADGKLSNIVVTMTIPKGLTINEAILENSVVSNKEIVYQADINRNTNVVVFTIQEIPNAYTIDCIVKTTVDNALGVISVNATATANGKEYIGNVLNNEVSKLDFSITQTRLDSAYVKEHEEITFEYRVTNLSDVYASDFNLENIIPDGMQIVSVEEIIDDNSSRVRVNEENGKITISETFKGGQTVIYRVTMKADLLPEGTTQKDIVNYATIYGTGFETKESNKVTATIEYNDRAYRSDDPIQNPENPASKKIISGVAWIDKNQDGERNDGEELITGMEVRLLNAENNELVNKTQTSSEGQYVFNGLENGDYLVVFLYDANKYEVTTYQKPGVSQSTNSDAIYMEMEIDGVNTRVGISNTIKLTDSNARNIDIGICDSNKSDLKIDKYISAITVSYGNTVNTFDYNNSKLAKVEIPAKQLSNATVIVEYKIVVTNEGAITNYVKKVVDYVPSDMKFNSELNRDWYQSSNGDVYNSSLANIELASGQSKELTLTLTKKMTSENTGIVNNNAELYEVYNQEGIVDKDSTPANKASGEDDMSAADVVIGVKTGDAVIYTIIIATAICAVIGIATFFIRKSLLKRI